MPIAEAALTGVERTFDADELIVSKTDLKGRITYANRVFLRIADYTEDEVLGQPHSIIRHPHMPRCVFQLLWERIQAGREIFAYVVNAAKNGDHYWVIAHVTPSFDGDNKVAGFHSNRRRPSPKQISAIKPVYDALLTEEKRVEDRRAGLAASSALFKQMLEKKGVEYDAFVLSI